MAHKFLPITKDDIRERGWDELDVILVTGDAYVDHPSYGVAVIGRVLEADGFRVGVIAQPGWTNIDDLKRLGRPRLFFGVTAGNLDSMVANYTANKKFRNEDEYAAGGKAGRRPDRALIMYTNRIRQAFKEVPVVIGGMEASMRRLAHYDYWTDTVRRSVLLDSKADILVYGMGESQVLEIARRIRDGEGIGEISGIRGTSIVRNSTDDLKDAVSLPSYEETVADKDAFNRAFMLAYAEQDPYRGRTIIQQHAQRYVVQHPPALPLSTQEMDRIYSLPYMRRPHKAYDKEGGVPGFETVRFSITSHRGCPGECSFCSLYAHQGRIVQSRSRESILNEIRLIASRPDFKGTITDIGGPTANLYEASCKQWSGKGACAGKRCLVPRKCDNLRLGYSETIRLWRDAAAIPGVRNIFIGSGVRYDLLNDKEADEYLKNLCAYHVSGQLKVAPEHSEAHVLDLMHKPHFAAYETFVTRYAGMNRKLNKKQYLVNYFIIGHPGATLNDALAMALALNRFGINPEQVQDFLPLPMTLSGAMYWTEKDPATGEAVYVAKGVRERKLQRSLIQFRQPQNKKYVIEALRSMNRMNAMKILYG